MANIVHTIKLVADAKKAMDDVRLYQNQIVATAQTVKKYEATLNGDQILKAANSWTAAVAKLGGATKEAVTAEQMLAGAAKLSASEKERVNKVVTEAIGKYQLLGKEAPSAMLALADATKKVEQPTSRLGEFVKSTFGQFTLASLASGGIQRATAALGDMIQKGAELPALETSFRRLTSSVGSTAEGMLGKLRPATLGLVTDMDLMKSANKAILLGLPVTEAQMGDLAKAATTLGRAMGQDATKSLDDLITALGRSSPMILDNLGLTVKVGEANEAYAAKLGKTADKLTQAEQKMAFYERAMEAARKKTAELGEQTRTLSEIVESVFTKVTNIVTGAAGDINVALGRALSSGKEFAQFLSDLAKYGTGGAIAAAKLRSDIEAAQGADPFMEKVRRDLAAHEAKLAEEAAEAARIAAEAAKKHADTIKGIYDTLSGAQARAQAQYYAEALRGVDVSKLTAKAQDDIRTTMQAAIDTYVAAGQTVPPNIWRIYEAVKGLGDLIPVVSGLASAVGQVVPDAALNALPKQLTLSSRNLSGVASAIVAPKGNVRGQAASIFATLFGSPAQFGQDMAATIMSAIQGGGNAFNAAGGLVGSKLGEGLAKHLTTAGKDGAAAALSGWLGGAVSAVLPVVGSLVGPLVGAIAGLFDRNKGRDTVTEWVTKNYGSFDQFHASLLKLADAGKITQQQAEAMWKALTQGVGRNDVEGAKRAIAEVEKTLSSLPPSMVEIAAQAGYQTTAQLRQAAQDAVKLWEYMRDSGQYTAAQVQQAWERAQSAMTDYSGMGDAIDAARKKVEDLDNEIKSLQAAVDAEAPEEEMGIIERQQRQQLANLQQQREEAAKTLETLTQQMKDSMDDVTEAINKLPKEIAIALEVELNGRVTSSSTAATGGVVTRRGIRRFAAGGAVGTDTVHALLTPGEVVLNAAQQANIADALVASAWLSSQGKDAVRDAVTQGVLAAGGLMYKNPLTPMVRRPDGTIGHLPPVAETVKDSAAFIAAHMPGRGSTVGDFVEIPGGGWVPKDHPLAKRFTRTVVAPPSPVGPMYWDPATGTATHRPPQTSRPAQITLQTPDGRPLWTWLIDTAHAEGMA